MIKLSENKATLALVAVLLIAVFATEGAWVALATFLVFLNAFLLIQAVFPIDRFYVVAYLICTALMIFMGMHFVVLAWILVVFVFWPAMLFKATFR